MENKNSKPTNIQILRGSGCNVACRFCFTQRLEGDHGIDTAQKLEEYSKISYSEEHLFLAMLYARMAWGLNEMLFSSYGDPLAKQNAPELLPKEIAMAHELGYPQITVLTNGVGLTKELLDQMVEAGLTNLTISLHTKDSLTHQEIVRPPGNSGEAHKKIREQIKYAVQSHPNLVVRINVGYFDIVEETEELIAWAKDELGAHQITFVEPILSNTWSKKHHRKLPEKIEGYIEESSMHWGLRVLKPQENEGPVVALCSFGDQDPTFTDQQKNVMLTLSDGQLKIGGLWDTKDQDIVKSHLLH